MPAPTLLRNEFDTLHLEMEFAIAAKKPRVWKALVKDIGKWWPKDFAVGQNVTAVVLEPRLGGRLYEDWGDGAGATWYTIETFAPPDSLELLGRLSKDFGGPAWQLTVLRLEERGPATVLRLSDTVFGAIDKKMKAQLNEGWKYLFEGGLKAFVEKA